MVLSIFIGIAVIVAIALGIVVTLTAILPILVAGVLTFIVWRILHTIDRVRLDIMVMVSIINLAIVFICWPL